MQRQSNSVARMAKSSSSMCGKDKTNSGENAGDGSEGALPADDSLSPDSTSDQRSTSEQDHKMSQQEDDYQSMNQGSDSHSQESSTRPLLPPLPPVSVQISTFSPDWCEDSVGEGACSGDEKTPPKRNLHDVMPSPSTSTGTSTTTHSSISNLTNPLDILDPSSGQHLIIVEIQLRPEKDNLEVMFMATKQLLDYVQDIDPAAKFISRGKTKDGTPLPHLDSSSNDHWPRNYASASGWYQTSTGYIFSQPPITEQQL